MAGRIDAGRPPRGTAGRPVAEAEAALVRHYRRLVRLAYLALPADRDRHSRVLAAHAAVQRALPSRWTLRDLLAEPLGPDEDPLYAALRQRVLRAALRPRPGERLLAPRVWGLRLFTPGGGEADAALDRGLAGLDAPARAAFALLAVDGLTPAQAAGALRQAGAAEPGPAVERAERLRAGSEPGRPAFDPCAVRVQPTDLLRRRRAWGVSLGVAVLALTTTAAVLAGSGAGEGGGGATAARPRPVPPAGTASDPGRLVRTPADRWQHTARMDFSAWPARGDRRDDPALLGRALTAWAQPGPQTRAEPGTDTAPPQGPPHLLFAGTVDGAAVVVLYDGGRLARYTDGRGGGLDLARADDAGVTTAAAVVLRRQGTSARYLLAPWIEAADLRRSDQPDAPAKPLERTDGVTAAAAAPATAASPGPLADCRGAAVLQLRSSPTIAEKHVFLLADLGGLVPAHLTYTPPPDRAQPAREPREAAGPDALQAWARGGCAVPDASPGVKQLNLWAFAVQQLPQSAGAASWVCLRADRWDGEGSAATAVLLPGARGPQRTGGGPGRACSRFDQDTVGWTWWRSPQGTEFLLAAGSRRVARIGVKGPDWTADRPVPDHTLAVERPARAAVTVEGVLDGGTRIAPLR
ncbi:hypothetical protein RMN57_34790 [Kitasatospora sp. CM 4170]|uniref:DNA-directed RNA polymerase specialized sigma24 family protein n=1 Tax=Kitasatospora aburaviensis TaxID=67265 RepID=A0ABW1EV84_9ACTN|nr:hypothetical protein [Kitasatospora sp. CM 4170]WNM49500.1 hypothetical protein RMN57_34790 [Kitasatospora sp. CM 4170]